MLLVVDDEDVGLSIDELLPSSCRRGRSVLSARPRVVPLDRCAPSQRRRPQSRLRRALEFAPRRSERTPSLRPDRAQGPAVTRGAHDRHRPRTGHHRARRPGVRRRRRLVRARGGADVEIVVPVYNEEADARAVDPPTPRLPVTAVPLAVRDHDRRQRQHRPHLGHRLPPGGRARRRGRHPPVREGPGPGAASGVADESAATVVAYMDVDLSTDLDALLPLVAPLVSGHSDVAIGTRLASGSRVVRGPRREAISRGYNLILRATLRSGFSDAQCGFKAVRTDVARRAAAAGRGPGLVLRHRAARAGRAQRAAHPRGAGRLGRRPRLPRRRGRHRHRGPARRVAAREAPGPVGRDAARTRVDAAVRQCPIWRASSSGSARSES